MPASEDSNQAEDVWGETEVPTGGTNGPHAPDEDELGFSAITFGIRLPALVNEDAL